MKLDIFPFCNEKELLELRLRLLYDKIDKFILCEANRNNNGNPKPFQAKDILKSFTFPTDKVQVLEIDLSEFDGTDNRWVRENKQRNAASELISKDDICFVTDCDEIMDPEFIDYYSSMALKVPDCIIRIPMVFFISRADRQVYDETGKIRLWKPGFVCLHHHIARHTLSEIRESYSLGSTIDFKNIELHDNNTIKTAGWHFSWMGSGDTNADKFKKCLESDKPIFGSTLSNDALVTYIKHYYPSIGSMDILSRPFNVMQYYPIQLLPKLLFELPKVLDLVLPTFRLQNLTAPLYHKIMDSEDWFSFPLLYSAMVQKFPSGSIFVEVGSWRGRSASYMAVEIANSKKDIRFYCIDHWQGSAEHKDTDNLFEIFTSNMQPVKNFYRPIKMDSLSASTLFPDKSVDFIFIDASHDYESVKKDIECWYPKVKTGGVLAGHDYYPPGHGYYTEDLTVCGVYKAVNELFKPEDILAAENCFVIYFNLL